MFIHFVSPPVAWHDSHVTSFAFPKCDACENTSRPVTRGAGVFHSTRGLAVPSWHVAHTAGEGSEICALPAGAAAWQPAHVGKSFSCCACGKVGRCCASNG